MKIAQTHEDVLAEGKATKIMLARHSYINLAQLKSFMEVKAMSNG